MPFKVAEHSFQVHMPNYNSPLLLNYLFYGAHFCKFLEILTTGSLKIGTFLLKQSVSIFRAIAHALHLRTFARKFSNIDFCLNLLPLKDDELVMSEIEKKIGGHRLGFGENMPGRTPKSE